MNININLFATLRTGRFDSKNMEIPDNSTIKMICREIGIPDDQKLIILVNSKHAAFDHKLSGGDTVAIFPLVGGG